MITGYEPPQLIINEVLEVLASPANLSRYAFIFGPQFDLFRYTNAVERANMKGVPFVQNTSTNPAAQQLVPYEGLLPTHIVDQIFTQLYGENLEGQYWLAKSHVEDSDTVLYDFQLAGLSTPNKYRVIRRGAVITATYQAYSTQITSAAVVFGGSGYPLATTIDVPVEGGTGTGAVIRLTTNAVGVVTAAAVIANGTGYTGSVEFEAPSAFQGANVGVLDGTLIPDLYGRPVQANDLFYVTCNGTTLRRVVSSVERELTAPSYGTDAALANGQFAASVNNPEEADAASFGNIVTPSSWNLVRNHASFLGVNIVTTGSIFSSTLATLVISAPIAVQNSPVWPTQQAAGSVTVVGGAVTSVTLTDNGAGYFHGAIVDVVMTNAGSGYVGTNLPVVTVTPAPTGGITCVLQPVVTSGAISLVIVEPGEGYTTQPTITITGGNPGVPATATAILTNGVVSVTMTNYGSGYTSAPTVTFSAPGNTGAVVATGYAVIIGGVVGQVVITSTGYGYTTGVAATVSFSGGGGTSAAGTCVMGTSPVAAVTAVGALAIAFPPGNQLGSFAPRVTSHPEDWSGLVQGSIYNGQYGERYTITVTRGGTGSTGAVRIRSASGGFTADNVIPVQEGYGYVINHPALGGLAVELTPPGPTSPLILGQQFSFVVFGKYKPLELAMQGQVLTVNVAAGGNGWASAPTVAFAAAPAGGTTATATANITGEVASIVIGGTNSGYSVNPTIAFSGGGGTGAAATAVEVGGVISITLTNPGSGYTSSPTMTISVASGSNTASATSTITGVITSFNITNPGSGYLYPPAIVLTGGGGSNAILNAVISTPTNSRDLAIIPGGTFVGAVNDRYLITVVKGDNLGDTQNSFEGATIQVSDTAGIDAPVNITLAEGTQYPLGTSGLSFMFPTNLVGPSGLTGGTTATGTATVTSNAVSAVAVTSGGSGYVIPPVVSVVGGGGSGALVEALLINGVVVDLVVLSGGSGYTSTPTISIAAPVTYQGGLRTGDVYYIDCVAPAATGPASTIVMSGQATDITGWTNDDILVNLFNIDARVLYSGILTPQRDQPPLPAWTAGNTAAGGISVLNNLDLQLTTRTANNQWIPVQNSAFARLFASWRGLVPALVTDSIVLYPDTATAISKFGENDIDNPICYGLCIAIQAAQGLPVYALALQTNDIAGYTTILSQASRIFGPEYLAPMTSDQPTLALLGPHVDQASEGTSKLWRRAYVSVASPGPYASITQDNLGNPLTAVVTANVGGNVRVFSPNANFITNAVLPGDLYRTSYGQDAWGNVTYNQYVVLEVLEEDELLLVSGPPAPINPAIPCQIWKADTGTSQAQFVGNRSASYNDRRIDNIWSDGQYTLDANSNVVPIPLYYVAAEIAGIRSAVLPQQGLSRTPLQYSIQQAPTMYTKYLATDLNIAAALGTFIVTQDSPGGPVYIRHQLTTDTDQGSLYYEDGVGVNLDDIAYQVEAMLAPYPGRRNATNDTAEEIETKLRGLFDSMKQLPSNVLNLIGSQIVDYSNLQVSIDPNFADRMNVSVTIYLPLPLNILTVTLFGAVSNSGTTVITTTSSS